MTKPAFNMNFRRDQNVSVCSHFCSFLFQAGMTKILQHFWDYVIEQFIRTLKCQNNFVAIFGTFSWFLAIFKNFCAFFFRHEWQTFPGRLWSSFSLPSSGYTQALWTRPEISPWGYPGICQSGWPFGVRKPEGRYGMSALRYNWMAWGTFAMGHRRWWKVNLF